MKHVYLFLGLLLSIPTAWAQRAAVVKPALEPRQPARAELLLEKHASDVQVQPLAEDSSVVVLVERDPMLTGKVEFSFQKYDHDLQPVRQVTIPVPRGYEFQRLCAERTDVYAVFSGSEPGLLWVAAFDTRTGELGTGEFKTKRAREIHELKALDGNLFVTVEVDQHLTILLLDLHTARFQFLPSVYEPLPTRFTFLADSVTKRAELILSETNGYKSRLQLKQLADDGRLLRSEFVQASSERGLLDAQLSPGDSAARLLAGTYTLRDSRYSQGLFASDLTAGVTATGQRRSLRYYDFLNLKHFFDFMKPAKVARLRQRSERLRAADRQFRHRYQLLMHDMVATAGGFVLVSEVYYPRYSSNTHNLGNWGGLANYSNLGGYNGFGYPSRYNNFYNGTRRAADGFRTTQALICGFDRQGNLLWDNSFPLKEVEHFQLQETVRMRPFDNGRRMAMAYLKDDVFHYKIVDQAAATPNDWQVTIRPANSTEKTSETTQEQLMPWFGSRFLACGYQHVRPEKGAGRNVFFLSALEF